LIPITASAWYALKTGDNRLVQSLSSTPKVITIIQEDGGEV